MQSGSSSLHCHLVLLGQVGVGKSATGNTILGQRTFQSKKSLKAVTQDVQSGTVTINGLSIDVYDTPGFLSPGVQNEDIASKCQTLLQFDASVPTAFILVIGTDRFGEQEMKAAELVLYFIGANNLQNTWIIFTKGDELQSNEITIKQYMEDSEELKELVQKVHNQYLVFNNKHDPSNREQAEELISRIMCTDMSISQTQLSHTSQQKYQNQGVEILPNQDQIRPCPATGTTSSDQNYNLAHRKILLLGKTGVGKSATGNTILGDEAFRIHKMKGTMMNVCLNLAFVSGIIPASDTDDVAAGIGEVPGHSGAKLMPNNSQQRVPVNIKDTPVSSPSSRRIVLLGKTGVGKSAAGNTILGQREFNSEMRMSSVTSECSVKHATVSGRSVSVVDTPGLFDTEMKPEELVTEIARSMYLSSPGPHAFLIVIPVNNRFTEQELQILQQIKTLFGEEVLKYSIILFTHGDQLDGESVEKLIQENCRLRDLVDQCGGRFHIFNNRHENNRDQVNDLLKKIDTMIEKNGGGHYSNQMFQDADRFRREEEERKKEGKEQRLREEEEERRQSEQGERRLREGEERRQSEQGERRLREGEERRLREGEERRLREGEEQRLREGEEQRQREGEEQRQREEEERRLSEGEVQRPREDEGRRLREGEVQRPRKRVQRQRQENFDRERMEPEQRFRAPQQPSHGFLLFLSKYEHHIYKAAIAAGLVISCAVGGAVVYGVVGGGVAGAVFGGAERRTVTGAVVGAVGGAVGGAAVGAAVSGVVVAGGAAAATVGAVAKAVGVGAVGGAAVGGAAAGASSGTVKGAVVGALAGAAVGGAIVCAAAVGAVRAVSESSAGPTGQLEISAAVVGLTVVNKHTAKFPVLN